MTVLGIVWFFLIAVLLCGYFILDGFDLGAGVLYPILGHDEHDRSMIRRAIGPFWDGNEVWLLTAGGALFAAFAPAYATSFSGFYLAIMLVLFGLIVRAIALEFRAHDTGWHRVYDVMFTVGSLLPALLCGVAIGNVINGLPLNANGDYTGTFWQLLNPFSLAVGVLGLVHMLTQGASWIALKCPRDAELRERARTLRQRLAVAEIVLFILTAVLFFVSVVPSSAAGITATPLAVVFACVYIASVLGGALRSNTRDINAHILNGVGCVALVGMVGATLFPNLIPAVDPAYSVTIANAASSEMTLMIMLIIALIGVPLVLVYHVITYRVFRGRLAEEDLTY